MITRPVIGRFAAVTRRYVVAGAIATVAVLAAAQPAWASWVQQSPPSPATNAQLNGVSCTSSTDCLAVGSYTNSSGTFQLAETSNGSTWAESDPENPPGATNTVLNGVSCAPAWCMAVGETSTVSSSSPVSQLWTGASWTTATVPTPNGTTSSQLNGVSCVSTGCIAVGAYTTSSGTFPLAETWNGASWSVLSAAVPSGSNSSQLYGVSCLTQTSCEAVGSITETTGTLSLAELWSGTSWAIQATPTPAGSTYNNLDSVSCTSTSHCMAVGTGIAEDWNGASWNVTTPVKPPGDTGGPPYFSSVSCVSATSCVAVGTFYFQSVTTATAELWNGTAWHAQSLTISDSDQSGLDAIACPLVHACTAVGWFQDTVTLRDMTLAQVYSLNWVNQDEPPLGGTITSSISSVSCGKYCTEAGNSLDSNGEPQGFIQYGSFNNWNYRQVANLANSTFNGLWCASTEASCVVVGETRGPAPLAEVFNGIAFAVASTPLPAGATDGGFYSVSCSSPTNCLAVGFYDVSDNEHALAETWNGSQWSLADPPEPTGSTYTVLNGVSCTTSSCVAVGNYGDPSFNQQPLSEVYTAGSWTTPTVSLPAGGSNPDMTSVSCGATNACLAVGQYFNGSADVPLAAKWNGATWASQKPPAPSGSAVTSFLGVACTSATSCEAVGSWNDSSSNSYTLAEGLNGKAWTIQTTPSTGDTNSEFLGVSCSSATSCTGVGDVSGPSPMSVLVETYS